MSDETPVTPEVSPEVAPENPEMTPSEAQPEVSSPAGEVPTLTA